MIHNRKDCRDACRCRDMSEFISTPHSSCLPRFVSVERLELPRGGVNGKGTVDNMMGEEMDSQQDLLFYPLSWFSSGKK